MGLLCKIQALAAGNHTSDDIRDCSHILRSISIVHLDDLEEEKNVSARFIFMIVGLIGLMLPVLMLNLSLQRTFGGRLLHTS